MMQPQWEYCSLQLEQKVGQRSSPAQTYRGVQVEEPEQAVWEVHCTLRLPGGDMRRTVFEQGTYFVDELNKLGQEGWELTAVVDEKNGLFELPQAATSSSWIVKSFIFRRVLTSG